MAPGPTRHPRPVAGHGRRRPLQGYNDQFGHQAGDRALKSVAARLRQRFQRLGDVVARYGGEEFVVLLPETSAADAERLAADATQRVRDLRIPQAAAPGGYLTISAGVASTTRRVDDDPETLPAYADEALYAAKTAGRDTVQLATANPLVVA